MEEKQTNCLTLIKLRSLLKLNFIRSLTILVVGLLFFIILPITCQAASLYLSPTSGSQTIGSNFSVSVYVSSSDNSMNAASGEVVFPADKLEVISVSKSGSIISLWVQEPSFSNSEGKVRFEGIVLNPGYTGASGKLISINFKTKAAGTASLSFVSGSVLANDGKGTNILTSLGSAQFSLVPFSTGPQAEEASSPVTATGVPGAPKVTSSTHPDPNKWYANNNPTFEWTLPEGVNGVNVLADRNPTTDPGTKSDGLRNSWTYKNVEEGVWYFHIRLHNAKGWGAVTHFRFQIDITPPEPFTIKFIDEPKTTNPTPTVIFDTTDSVSGIDYYRVKVGDKNFVNIDSEQLLASNPYTLSPQAPGKHNLLVQAFDQAGNYVTDSQEFEIIPLDQPQLRQTPQELAPNEILIIKGKTYSDSIVHLTLTPEGDKPQIQKAKSDSQGNFTLVWPKKLSAGTYQYSLYVEDARGAQSEPTKPLTLLVREKPLLKAGQIVVSYLTVVITIISLLITLLLVGWYSIVKFRRLRRRLQKEVGEAEQILHQSLLSLQDKVKSQLRLLERAKSKRELTIEEQKIIKNFKQDLAITEKAVRKEIKDIEKEVD